MKRILVFLVLALAMALCMSNVCFASQVEASSELEGYIKEKIVPVVVGVLTAVIALITTLGSVAKSLNELKDTKSTFKSEAEQRSLSFDKSAKLLDEQAKRLECAVKDVPEIKEKISILNNECKLLAQLIALGFSSNEDIVRSGRGHEMAALVKELGTQEMENEKN